MCGIAGWMDLTGSRLLPPEVLRAMADALFHRGPDEEGSLERAGLGLASRRLSILDLKTGRQPIANEDQSIWVVFNGELFDYPEVRADLEARGHRFVTHCDTELIPHLWEEFGEGMFDRLRGQFALALWDQGQNRLILARDRFGIAPLYWTEQAGWLLFASEIKALLASGMVEARPDRRGLDQLFTFFATPGPVTCFAGVSALLPGQYLDACPDTGAMRRVRYWDMVFPDRGEEDRGGDDPRRLVDGLEAALVRAVERRLR